MGWIKRILQSLIEAIENSEPCIPDGWTPCGERKGEPLFELRLRARSGIVYGWQYKTLSQMSEPYQSRYRHRMAAKAQRLKDVGAVSTGMDTESYVPSSEYVGNNIERVVPEMVALANAKNVSVRMIFNDVEVVVPPHANIDIVLWNFRANLYTKISKKIDAENRSWWWS